MRRASLYIVLFVLAPAALSFLVMPELGILTLPNVNWDTKRYLLLFYFPAAMAAICLPFLRAGEGRQEIVSQVSWPIFVLFGVSILYVVVSMVDLIVYQEVFTYGISATWKSATDAGARNSLQGAVGLVLAGAPTLLVSLVIFNDGTWGDRRILGGLSIALFCLSLACMFAFSARNSVAISVAYVFLVAVLRLGFRGLPIRSVLRSMPKAVVAFAILVAIVAFVIILWLFVERAIVTKGTVDSAIQHFLVDYRARLKVDLPDNEALKPIFYALMMLEFYITHAAVYFSEYMFTGYCPGGDGAYSFYGAFRVIDFVFGTQFVETAATSMILPGVYLSLPGFLFLDFCGAGALVGWLLVGVTVLTVVLFFRQRPYLIFITAYLLCMFLFAPFYALPSTGNGFSLLIWSILVSGSGAIAGRSWLRATD